MDAAGVSTSSSNTIPVNNKVAILRIFPPLFFGNPDGEIIGMIRRTNLSASTPPFI
jgi:hypothetical protein